jgi:PEP-CTERM motif
MVVSELGDSSMRASVKLLASVALSIGLASTAFAHSHVDFLNIDGRSISGYQAAAGFPTAVAFSGDFVGPVTWTLTTLSNGTQSYALAGVLTGGIGAAALTAIAVPLSASMDRGFLAEYTAISGADTPREESVPEPSTLALMGTGSVGLLGVMWRRNGATRH